MNKLDEVFDIETTESKQIAKLAGNTVTVIPSGDISSNADFDYETSRANLHGLLCQGQDALFHALDVAKQSEHPRAFEVVGNLIKQIADINHQLMDLSDKRQKLQERSKQPDSGTTITNNTAYFVGSTAELNKMLSDMNKEK